MHEAIIPRRLFDQARQKRLACARPEYNPDHGKTWNGKRSQLILSGLMRCTLCGSRYQGVTRLDSLTMANRDLVGQRLTELKARLRELDGRLAEFDHLILSQVQIKERAAEASDFLGRLKHILQEGEPRELFLVLRQCIEEINVNRPDGSIQLRIRVVPGLAPEIRSTSDERFPEHMIGVLCI